MGEVTISLEKYISLVRMAGRVEAAIQYIKEESFPESKLIIAMLEGEKGCTEEKEPNPERKSPMNVLSIMQRTIWMK